ncbi:MAG: acyl-CoA dehydrogenase family protein, partial [Gammaproteobacteria bacterium]
MVEFFTRAFFWWPVFILVLMGLAAARPARGGWFISLFIFMMSFSSASAADPSTKQVLWSLYFLAALVAYVRPLRRWLISNRLLRFYRASMPVISSTERDALEAGGVWWDGDLFSGNPDWQKLLDFPAARISAEEQAFLDGPVERLCALLDDHRICNVDKDLTPETWSFIKQQGFFGMTIPKEYGGLEFSAAGHASVVMKIASRSISAALTVMIPNSVGPGKLLLRYGTTEQKNRWLPCLARGEEIPCFALTGPEAGSDAGAIPDLGVVCRGEFGGNKDVLGIRLDFEKRYISMA